MRVITDRQIKIALVIVEVPVLILIASILLLRVNEIHYYTEADLVRLCKFDVPKPADWRYIVLHHSASSHGCARMFDRDHRNRGWDGIGYDFVIGNGNGSGDGEIEVTDRWRKQKPGAHAGSDLFNRQGIGICLVGNFETCPGPTDVQYDSLVNLCAYLMRRFNIPSANVKRHKDVGHTKCPGQHFPFDALITDLKAELGEDPDEP